ncbi:hypothetical protein [Tepidibacillus fermentans]|uniref:Uncharacterized protein n=1 Tax=Tepidibacillus fermentans TaxID=1281767 RepID=A0A4R3K5A4_9BACI|nr:hypothetical protein [Tepidibacillus fermentans]TCS77949.1 hypothetical protein EDD72_1325 [Tepidibacillus fermentans]
MKKEKPIQFIHDRNCWIDTSQNGLIVLTNPQKIGEANSLEQYLKKIGSKIEVAVLIKTRRKGKPSVIMGGNPNGPYTCRLRQQLSRKYTPFLFLKSHEAELLSLILKDKRYLNWYLHTVESVIFRDIDPKAIEKGLILYSNYYLPKNEKPLDLDWLKRQLDDLSRKHVLHIITFWGTPRNEVTKEISRHPIKKVFVYPTNSSWKNTDPKIEIVNDFYQSTQHADVLIIGEPREEFMTISFPKIARSMSKKILIDPFYLFEREEMNILNWNYIFRSVRTSKPIY